jgi:hypothetical protein
VYPRFDAGEVCCDDVFAAALAGEQAIPTLHKGLGYTCPAKVNYRGQFPLVLGIRPADNVRQRSSRHCGPDKRPQAGPHGGTNAETHRSRFRLDLIGVRGVFWISMATVYGVEHAGKFGEHTIAGGVRDPTPVLVDEFIDQGSMSGQCRHCRFFIAMHQAAIGT